MKTFEIREKTKHRKMDSSVPTKITHISAAINFRLRILVLNQSQDNADL